MTADRIRRVVEIEVDPAGTLLLDPALESAVGCLIIAGIGVPLLGPAALLPVRNLAALDLENGGLPSLRLPPGRSFGSG
jgi:hypothetical protein